MPPCFDRPPADRGFRDIRRAGRCRRSTMPVKPRLTFSSRAATEAQTTVTNTVVRPSALAERDGRDQFRRRQSVEAAGPVLGRIAIVDPLVRHDIEIDARISPARPVGKSPAHRPHAADPEVDPARLEGRAARPPEPRHVLRFGVAAIDQAPWRVECPGDGEVRSPSGTVDDVLAHRPVLSASRKPAAVVASRGIHEDGVVGRAREHREAVLVHARRHPNRHPACRRPAARRTRRYATVRTASQSPYTSMVGIGQIGDRRRPVEVLRRPGRPSARSVLGQLSSASGISCAYIWYIGDCFIGLDRLAGLAAIPSCPAG